jgi:ABC-type nitrate/sulfonate/bicarbonate transport system permease component
MILVAMAFVGICGASTTWVLGVLENQAMPWRKGRVTT